MFAGDLFCSSCGKRISNKEAHNVIDNAEMVTLTEFQRLKSEERTGRFCKKKR